MKAPTHKRAPPKVQIRLSHCVLDRLLHHAVVMQIEGFRAPHILTEAFGAFAGIDGSGEGADVSPGILDSALLSGAHPMLDLGEGLLDRIEIGRVRRQVPKPCAGSPDHAAEGCRLVAAEIVHDDVAGLENWNELLFDICAEAFAVDRAVEDTRDGELIPA
jgi:hypothetical protein